MRFGCGSAALIQLHSPEAPSPGDVLPGTAINTNRMKQGAYDVLVLASPGAPAPQDLFAVPGNPRRRSSGKPGSSRTKCIL